MTLEFSLSDYDNMHEDEDEFAKIIEDDEEISGEIILSDECSNLLNILSDFDDTARGSFDLNNLENFFRNKFSKPKLSADDTKRIIYGNEDSDRTGKLFLPTSLRIKTDLIKSSGFDRESPEMRTRKVKMIPDGYKKDKGLSEEEIDHFAEKLLKALE